MSVNMDNSIAKSGASKTFGGIRGKGAFAAAAGMAVVALAAAGAPYGGDAPDCRHAWCVHDWNRPKPVKVEVGARGVPSDAIVLFDGTRASLDANWCDEKGAPTKWQCSEGGFFFAVPGWKNGGAIRTKEEFGDCQLHIEYRHDPARIITDKGPQMRGNSGVFLMGTQYGYEVQVLESYFTSREAEGTKEYVDNYADGQAGAVYAENPPAVNPARRPGEWQVYDIVFHQPVWKGETLLHPGSVTVFFNGVLVQDHWEMEGQTTHLKRRPLAPQPVKGPLMLQDHGCEVEYRNIWLRPIPSRWDNLTHSAMSADPAKVMELRRETAAKLFAKVADPAAATAENVKALAEVVMYSPDVRYAAAFWRALEAYRAKPGDAEEVKGVNRILDVLVRSGMATEDVKIKTN
jgi:hypothetical protein